MVLVQVFEVATGLAVLVLMLLVLPVGLVLLPFKIYEWRHEAKLRRLEAELRDGNPHLWSVGDWYPDRSAGIISQTLVYRQLDLGTGQWIETREPETRKYYEYPYQLGGVQRPVGNQLGGGPRPQHMHY